MGLVLFDNRLVICAIAMGEELGEWFACDYTSTYAFSIFVLFSRFRFAGAIGGFLITFRPYTSNTCNWAATIDRSDRAIDFLLSLYPMCLKYL